VKFLSLIVGFFKKLNFVFLNVFKNNLIHPGSIMIFGKGEVISEGGLRIKARGVIDLFTGILKFSNNVWVNHDVEFASSLLIEIGSGTTIQKRTTINGNVFIGRGCIIAPNVFISSGSHVFKKYPGLSIREQEPRVALEGRSNEFDKAIHIWDDVWLGIYVVIMPGVIIGNGVVVGAKSVVTKSLANGKVFAGIPAQQISNRDFLK
jgi:acetyltransferase-like isoleucine patch superfamily enzyme